MSHNNALNFGWSYINGLAAAPGLLPIKASLNDAGSGNHDLYTVPAGKRAFIVNMSACNQNGSSATVFIQIKLGGTYFRLDQNITVSTLQNGLVFPVSSGRGMILEAGDILAFNTSVNNTNVWAGILEFDNKALIKTVKITGLVSGNNTIYTCPSGKVAYMLSANCGTASGTGPMAVQTTGSSVNYQMFYVPSGGSVGTNTTATGVLAVTTNTGLANNTIGPSFDMVAGDSIVISSNSSTAGQMAWINIIEKDV